MALPFISNKNQRTTAILKVVGIYLISLILLVMVIFNNRDIEPATNNNLGEQNENLTEEVETLQQLMTYLGEFTDLTEQLIDNDNQILQAEKPGKLETQLKALEVEKDRLLKNLAFLEISDELVDYDSITKKVIAQLINDRVMVGNLRTDMKGVLLKAEDQVEKNQEEVAKELEDKKTEFQGEMEAVKEKSESKDKNLQNVEAELATKTEDLKELVEKINGIKELADEVHELVKGERDKIKERFLRADTKPFKEKKDFDDLWTIVEDLKKLLRGM